MVPAPIRCPITLDVPLSPQITPCGHVFSFPGIMQHLTTHGGEELRKSSPCPLCFHQIVARELRLVSVRQVTPAKVMFGGQEGSSVFASWQYLRITAHGLQVTWLTELR